MGLYLVLVLGGIALGIPLGYGYRGRINKAIVEAGVKAGATLTDIAKKL